MIASLIFVAPRHCFLGRSLKRRLAILYKQAACPSAAPEQVKLHAE